MGNRSKDEVDLILEAWERERPDVDPFPMAVFGRLARTRQLAQAELSETLDRFDLSLPSFDVLANLRRSGEPFAKTPSELATSSMLTSGGVTFRLDRLESEGLIRRVPSTEDRRMLFAKLTDKGRQLIDEVLVEHLKKETELLAGLTPKEQRQLAELLRKLERSITDVSETAGSAA